MPYLPLQLPEGVVRLGTKYQAKGRWYDSNLVRWHDGTMQPVGGWALLTNATSAAVGGAVRGMFAWKRNNGTGYIALGTPTKLYVYSGTTLSNVTPAGITTGNTDASGTYYARTEANSWQFDAFGEDLVAVAYSDGKLYVWDSSVGVGTAAAAAAGAPTSNVGVVVTPERFLVALGAGGDRRAVQWADQESTTSWTATPDNQAGDFPLSTKGNIQAGRRGRNETLIWTDTDLWAMRYIGGTLVYSFQQLGSECGAISRRSMAVVDGKAFWMGPRGFFAYDGYVRPIPCEVGDFVFNRVNRAQASKIAAHALSDFNEVWWYYPSGSGTPECDSYVALNYETGTWRLGAFERTDGIDRGFLEYPLAADASGAVYEHEQGTTYADEGGSPSYTPYIESGPVEIGEGDQTMMIRQYIPDEETLGEVSLVVYSALYPTATETTSAAFTAANPTDLRITARQLRFKFTQVTGGWRVGVPRFEVVPGSLR